MKVISVKNVSYSYKVFNEDGTTGKFCAVDDVCLEIEQGSFVALIGHNGCGKSTLAKLLNGLLVPESGSVEVFGLDTAKEENSAEVRKSVGMVFQNPDNQTVATIVEEDVAFGPENLGLPREEIAERVKTSLEQVNMSRFAQSTAHRLSGGQKQRIAIAGALALRPKVLVFDEATAMLDPVGRSEVLAVAKKLNAEGITVVLITHFPEEVLCADKVFVMNKGKIVANGTPKEIFAQSEMLASIGLSSPRVCRLAQKLNGAGWNIAPDICDAKVLGGEICRLLATK